MKVNFDSVARAISVHGTTVAVTTFTSSGLEYDADQNLLFASTGTTRKARVMNPTQVDITNSPGGKVSSISKKFVFPNDMSFIDNGDLLYYDSGTHEVVEVQKLMTRVIAFGNKKHSES